MLKFQIDKLEDVSEATRPLYEEKDGKFQLSVEGIPEPEEGEKARKALQAERKTAAELKAETKRWKDLGKTPEEIQEMIEAAAIAAEEKLKGAGEWDKLKAQMNEKHDAALKALQAKVDAKDGDILAMRKSLENHLIDAQATAAIAAAKGKIKPLLPHIRDQVKLVEENGNYSIKVVDAKGDPRVNGKGDPLTLADVVAEMRATDDFGGNFEGSGQSGSGTRPANSSGGASSQNKRRSEFKSEKERAEFIDTNGIDAYTSLPA